MLSEQRGGDGAEGGCPAVLLCPGWALRGSAASSVEARPCHPPPSRSQTLQCSGLSAPWLDFLPPCRL